MKRISTNVQACTGCKLCMLACSFAHEKSFSLVNSRIRERRDEITNESSLSVCRQCDARVCADVCPVEAIYFDKNLLILRVNREECLGCGRCVEACQHDGIFLDKNKKAVKCDLCAGDPICVRYCVFPQALAYVET